MSPRQIAALYLGRRDQYGQPVFEGATPELPAPEEFHRARCFSLGIRDPELVAFARDQLRAREASRPRKRKGR